MIHLRGELLDGVGKGVPEVEFAPFATLPLVASDNICLDLYGRKDNLPEQFVIGAQLLKGIVFKLFK